MFLNFCQRLLDSIFDGLIIKYLLGRIDKCDIYVFACGRHCLRQLALIEAVGLPDAAFEQVAAPRPFVVLLGYRHEYRDRGHALLAALQAVVAAQWWRHDNPAALKEAVDAALRGEAFALAEPELFWGVAHVGY